MDISWAKKLNLFSGNSIEVRKADGFEFVAKRNSDFSITFTLPIDPVLSQSFAKTDSSYWKNNRVGLTTVEMKFGPRLYFICPVTKKRCLKLLFYKGRAASREAFKILPQSEHLSDLLVGDLIARDKLMGQTGRQRLTAEERSKLVARLSRLKFKDPEVEVHADRDARKRMRKILKRIWESLPLSTTVALVRSRGVSMYAFREMELRDQSWFDAIPPTKEHPDAIEEMCITDVGELDIRILLSRDVFSQPEMSGQTLGWPAQSIDGYFVSMYVHPRPSGFPDLVMEIGKGDEALRYQRIELIGRRPYVKPRNFICPVFRVACDVLYFRFGYFASREAQNLKFPKGGKRMHALKLFHA